MARKYKRGSRACQRDLTGWRYADGSAREPRGVMEIAPTGQSFEQSLQPMQRFGSLRKGYVCGSGPAAGSPRSRQLTGQVSTQIRQGVQISRSKTGLGHSAYFIFAQTLPASFLTASTGQTLQQLPQSMHSEGVTTWRAFFSPLIAPVGHIRRHAPQPLQMSVIVWAIIVFLMSG